MFVSVVIILKFFWPYWLFESYLCICFCTACNYFWYRVHNKERAI